jgi:hypothetical protein
VAGHRHRDRAAAASRAALGLGHPHDRRLFNPRGRDKVIWIVNLALLFGMVLCVASRILISLAAATAIVAIVVPLGLVLHHVAGQSLALLRPGRSRQARDQGRPGEGEPRARFHAGPSELAIPAAHGRHRGGRDGRRRDRRCHPPAAASPPPSAVAPGSARSIGGILKRRITTFDGRRTAFMVFDLTGHAPLIR